MHEPRLYGARVWRKSMAHQAQRLGQVSLEGETL
eukprot:SAG31_NODE_21019_length_559_cov_1.352174_1_plen_33_part_10